MKSLSSLIGHKKIIIWASLGLFIPVFIISMAFLAVKSDAKNQAMYQQQQAEIIQRIEAKTVAKQDFADAVSRNSTDMIHNAQTE